MLWHCPHESPLRSTSRVLRPLHNLEGWSRSLGFPCSIFLDVQSSQGRLSDLATMGRTLKTSIAAAATLIKHFTWNLKKSCFRWVAVISAKNHKRQPVSAKREKSQTPKVLTAILTLPNLTQPNLT